jgi:hypothetical protein
MVKEIIDSGQPAARTPQLSAELSRNDNNCTGNCFSTNHAPCQLEDCNRIKKKLTSPIRRDTFFILLALCRLELFQKNSRCAHCYNQWRGIPQLESRCNRRFLSNL